MHVNKFLLIALIVFSACTKKEILESAKKLSAEKVQLPEKKLDGIEFKPVEKKLFPITLNLSGRVAIPDKDFYVLSARTAGRIDSLPLNIGDHVHVGTTVATLWSPDLATAVDEYEIAKAQKGAELIQLSEEKLRALGVSPKDAISGRVSFPLRSTMDGVVLDRKQNAGSSVNPGDQIMTIGKSGSFQFQADVPPSDALLLKPGMKVIFEDNPNLKASVDSVSTIADPASRLVRVRCKFEDIGNVSLAQETFLKAKVILKERESLVSSVHALVVDEESQYIFVQDLTQPKIFSREKVRVTSTTGLEMAFEFINEKLDLTKAGVITEGALLLNGVLEDSD